MSKYTSRQYRQDSQMYQQLASIKGRVDFSDLAVDPRDDDTPPWVDDPAPRQDFTVDQFCQVLQANRANTTTTTQEDTAMTTTTTAPTSDTLEQFFSQLGQYPRNNVLERCIQTLISEAARAIEFADRVRMGDNKLPIELDEAGFPRTPIDDFERPAPDTDGTQGRTLSEAQFSLVTSLEDDEVTALSMVKELVDIYQKLNGEKPAYSIFRTPAGRWERITDINKALKHEYMKAHASWLRKQAAAAKEGFDKAGAEHLRRENSSRRAALLGEL